ncbi:MAG TPA: hypothetical protein VN176_10530 [Verrucomicrobiae bacterium]|jgi:hypothetical protein|nr:hypothetical protein [Verrucomicrobiae bacterium]
MESEIRTVVTFESTAFNMTEPKDYFINHCCFGDDVAEWVIRELRKQGMGTDEKPGQEDFGWYLNFEAAGIGHTFVIGHRPHGESEAGTWIGWLERKRGLIRSILGGRRRGIEASAAQAIHQILTASPMVRDVRWHFPRDFDSGIERGASSPLTPP